MWMLVYEWLVKMAGWQDGRMVSFRTVFAYDDSSARAGSTRKVPPTDCDSIQQHQAVLEVIVVVDLEHL